MSGSHFHWLQSELGCHSDRHELTRGYMPSQVRVTHPWGFHLRQPLLQEFCQKNLYFHRTRSFASLPGSDQLTAHVQVLRTNLSTKLLHSFTLYQPLWNPTILPLVSDLQHKWFLVPFRELVTRIRAGMIPTCGKSTSSNLYLYQDKLLCHWSCA